MKNLIYILASICFIVVIGGAIYEHTTMVPIWSSAPPASLTMFQGEYGIRAGNFWRPVHPVCMVLMIAALVLNWRTPRRKFIAATIVGYLIVMGVTFAYFVPELMAITETPLATIADASLTARAQTWEKLSLVRLSFLLLLAICLLFGLTKVERKAD